ncbi:MAG: transcriptional repressor [Dehalococcoidales bacterium]|nr:transcriptional repressor [Dehalococcoidales bacterium]
MSRKSIQREAVFRVVTETASHPGADWVYDQVKKVIPNISMGTVYRNLKFLAESGKIRELHIPGGPSRFDGNTSLHYHFRCEKCSRLLDLDLTVDPAIEKNVAQKTGYLVKSHYLEFRGLCPDCQEHYLR